MSKRTVFTTITPLGNNMSRELVIEAVHDHFLMIDLNPLVQERHTIEPPKNASPEEYHCKWYQITDKITYIPGGIAKGKVSYNACFHDLPNGLQTHVYAPLGLDIRSKWLIGGSLPGEPLETPELGLPIPKEGLYLREDVDMRCNIMMTGFVKKNLKKSHEVLKGRLVERAHRDNRKIHNDRLSVGGRSSPGQASLAHSVGSADPNSPISRNASVISHASTNHPGGQQLPPGGPLHPGSPYNQGQYPAGPYSPPPGQPHAGNPYAHFPGGGGYTGDPAYQNANPYGWPQGLPPGVMPGQHIPYPYAQSPYPAVGPGGMMLPPGYAQATIPGARMELQGDYGQIDQKGQMPPQPGQKVPGAPQQHGAYPQQQQQQQQQQQGPVELA